MNRKPPTTKNINVLEGIECPSCQSQGPFRMAIKIIGMVLADDDGWEDFSSDESEFLGPAYCRDCGETFDAMCLDQIVPLSRSEIAPVAQAEA